MKYLDDGVLAFRSDYQHYSQYVILRPDTESDGSISGPGIEAKVIHPTSDYTYADTKYYGDVGWERLFRATKFNNGYGISNGVGVFDDNLPLFNVYQTYSMWRSVHSHTDFRKYVSCMIGITYLDMIYRFGSKTVVDKSLSKAAQPLIEGFHLTGLGPRPTYIETNRRDSEFDYDEYVTTVNLEEATQLDENFLYYGHMGFKYEMSRLEKDPPDLVSPRWWRQSERESLELSDIICDNQIELF
jgi:hypothetical protein